MNYIPTVINSFAWLTLFSGIFLVGLLLFFLSRRFFKVSIFEKGFSFLSAKALHFALAVALAATLGSLFLSEIALFTPCKLCWFQRIFMYPQAIILLIAIIFKDARVKKYIIPLCLIGGAYSVYHYYLQLNPPQTDFCSLVTPESCAQTPFFYFGYLTIPVMSLTASALILILMLLPRTGVNGVANKIKE